jgi:hypothetical protein
MARPRVAVVLAGVLVVGGAVVALRLSGGTPGPDATAPPPPAPTVVKPYSADGVLVPTAGPPPARPGRVTVTAGPHRLQLAWGTALPGGHDPAGAAGYDVRWTGHDLLVAEPFAELGGVDPGAATQVQVRSVDSYGQRSAPVTVTGRALRYPPAGADDAFVDDFTGPPSGDGRRWELFADSQCAQAGRGTGANGNRLMILNQCGQTSATLAARTPLRLGHAANGELGRFTVDTDSPGENGELDIDLVPGQVAMIDGSANDPVTATKPGVAVIDDNLPPGTIRVRIAVSGDADPPADTVQVAAGPGTPRVPPVAVRPHAIPAPRAGISVRWDVVLRTDGVQVLRDGALVGAGDVVPQWTTAEPLLEFSGSNLDPERDDINMIGYGGAPTSTPPLVAAPRLTYAGFPVVTPGAATKAIDSTATGPGSAELRMTVVVSPNSSDPSVTLHGSAPKFAVQIGDHTYLATPAVPGTVLLPEVRYPLVARIPADALHAASLQLTLVVDAPTGYAAQVQLTVADLDVVAGPGHRAVPVLRSDADPQQPQLAGLSVQVLDASGQPPPDGKLPRGRAVLDVRMDGGDTQRTTGEIAGLAGFEVLLDDKKLVGVPTVVDGPGVGGDWQIAFATGDETAGPHSVDVRAYSTQEGIPIAETVATYQLGR